MKIRYQLNENMIFEEDDKNKTIKVIDFYRDNPEIQSGYCQFNPKVGQFARANAENFSLTIIFIIASIMQDWPSLKLNFHHLSDDLVRLYSNKPVPKTLEEVYKDVYGKEFVPGKKGDKLSYHIPWIPLVTGKWSNIKTIWDNRDAIFEEFDPLLKKYHNEKDNNLKENHLFDIYMKFSQLPNLGLVKAGFAVQMIVGRLGCVDSNNITIFRNILTHNNYDKMVNITKDGSLEFKQVKGAKKVPDKEFLSVLKKDAKSVLDDYVKFLNDIQKSGDKNESQRIWDIWTELISQKIINTGKKGKIEIAVGQNKATLNPYIMKMDSAKMKNYLDKYGEPDDKGVKISQQHQIDNSYEAEGDSVIAEKKKLTFKEFRNLI